eukprot:TRINITY_DN5760_c0_g1_i1.p1 TRINITY_DN5760_c0_g1~~TRINITY_DN5760_c0_g1_i1.p1  ORF type:complete len:637 (-),score=144.26 TRINITY_DN5760_c0_g1_i1:97-2007(-)
MGVASSCKDPQGGIICTSEHVSQCAGVAGLVGTASAASDIYEAPRADGFGFFEEDISKVDAMLGLQPGSLRARTPRGQHVAAALQLASKQQPPGRLATPLLLPGGLVPALRGAAFVRSFRNSYERAEKIGHGGYGEVFHARHLRSEAIRAVKVIQKADLKRYVADVATFIHREVGCLRSLDHPNVVRMYDCFEDDTSLYIVMELLEGGDLLERITASRPRLPDAEAAAVVGQIFSAVEYLWRRGILHRDVKPENFMFTYREPQREQSVPALAPLKLIDFGLSRRVREQQRVGTGERNAGRRASARGGMVEVCKTVTAKVGTTEYMAPEAASAVCPIDVEYAERLDVWSLGVVLHVLLTGHFPSNQLAVVNPEEYFTQPCWKGVPSGALDLLRMLLRVDPAGRPSFAMALRHPWLAKALQRHDEKTANLMATAAHRLSWAPDLKRLAVTAAAREVDDRCLYELRAVYGSLCLLCDGALTRQSLERLTTCTGGLGGLAAQLVSAFEAIDIDGSGAIDWTEFVAIYVSTQRELRPAGNVDDCRTVPTSTTDHSVTEETAPYWRAFHLMSQGRGAISAATLAELAARCAERRGFDEAGFISRYDGLVHGVSASGMVSWHGFLKLVRGECDELVPPGLNKT